MQLNKYFLRSKTLQHLDVYNIHTLPFDHLLWFLREENTVT